MVYRAQDTLLNRAVALKILYPELSEDPLFVERFRREAQAAANLSHPNIVPVFDWGEDRGTYFIVMELIEGTSLADMLRGSATISASRSAQIVAQVAAALGYAHRSGVVHRDVKPGNILIFHINGRGWSTGEALPSIVGQLRRRGYRFTRLDALLP